MVNENNEEKDVDIDVTNEETGSDDIELEDAEAQSKDKLKQLREKLKTAEEDKRKALEELQRTKADFLNAKRRLEEEKNTDRVRIKKQFIEDLLPLCDSFAMAMGNTEAWEKADTSWRKGVEGIHAQLRKLLESYGVSAIDPVGEPFDPNRHEAIGTEKVDDAKKQDTVLQVMQTGYELRVGEKTEVIRPARVTTGEFES